MSSLHGLVDTLQRELAALRGALAATASTARLTALEGEVARLRDQVEALVEARAAATVVDAPALPRRLRKK